MKSRQPFILIWAMVLIGTALILSSCPSSRPSIESDLVKKTPASGPIVWKHYNTHSDPIRSMTMDGDDLWMGTMKGIIRFNPKKGEHEIYTPKNTNGGFIARAVYILSVDSKGNKWVGTYGGGLSRFDGQTWTRYSKDDGLGDNWVYDIEYDRDGKMWVATWDGVSVFDGEHFKTYRVADGLPDKWVYSIALDRDGIFWFGTEGGISRFDGKSWTTYSHKNGVEGGIQETPGGGGTGGSSYPEGGADEGPGKGDYASSFLEHHMKAGKQNAAANPDFIISSTVDKQDTKWFGTWGSGVVRYDGKSWTTYTTKEGLGGQYIFALVTDPEGRVWAGTNGGASWFDGTRWQTINQSKGLPDDNIFSIYFDKSGRRWFGSAVGLSVFQGDIPSE